MCYFTGYSQNKKHALIIAIGDYPAESGWHKISSLNDTALIIPALLKNGFQRNNIHFLLNGHATKNNVTDYFRRLAAAAQDGDIVYIHFSCHGQQIFDQNGDEPDGFDEALIPIDAYKFYDSTAYTGEKHLRDDELGFELDKIRSKVGNIGDVLVTIDACHSGTATREIGISRGTNIKFCPLKYQPDIANKTDKYFFECVESESLSPIVIISASGASQKNNEYEFNGKSFGSLSFALSKALSQLNEGDSYSGLFGQIEVTMSYTVPGQSPQIEGDANRKVFAGEIIKQEPYYKIKYWRDYDHIIINAGELLGINAGAIVELYQIGTSNFKASKPIASGKIVETNLTESLVQLDDEVDKNTAINSWAFITHKSFPFENVKVKVECEPGTEIYRQILDDFSKVSFIDFAEKYPDLLLVIPESPLQEIELIQNNGQVLLKQNPNLSDNDVIYNSILEYAQAGFLRSLNNNSTEYSLDFQIIPVDKNGRAVKTENQKAGNLSGLKLVPGDLFKIEIKNKGKSDAYYSIIDIQPDNKINVLVPEKDPQGFQLRSPVDCFIKSGETELINSVFFIAEPYGQEVFKLIASREPLHLDNIHQTRGAISEGTANPFELLFSGSFSPNTRGTNNGLPADEIGISTVVFEIVD
jgi:hypothetical protein